jgi:dihydroxyacetone kinase
MTRVRNDPQDFARQALEGLAAANRHLLRLVPGGVTRAVPGDPGTVAVVVGGGSGHYPAFAGLVGRGLAHGAVVGNIFASPSAQQACSVAREANRGGGVLFCYGNYSGDVLHFSAALDRLASEGIEARQVLVTDDVSSAGAGDLSRRRGIAGGLVVFKTAGAAADRGHSLSEVTRIAELANARTRSFGVAFAGCTLPGGQDPLFTIAPNRMAVGMGIHGEPGIGEADLPSADELAELLVSRLLSELPPGVDGPSGKDAVVLLNGLGSVKYEELFVLYRRVDELLTQAGVRIVEPEVGELVTSLDMAGVSLTTCWLTDELADLWHAPAESPGFRKGGVFLGGEDHTPQTPRPGTLLAVTDSPCLEAPSGPPRPGDAKLAPLAAGATVAAAAVAGVKEREGRFVRRDAAVSGGPAPWIVTVCNVFDAIRDAVEANVDELGRLDAVAGDGDHGEAMLRGATAAAAAARTSLDEGFGAGSTLVRAGGDWSDASGGASGALWEVGLRALGQVIGDEQAPDAGTVVAAVRNCSAEVMRVGGAVPGDKTLVDVLAPFETALAAHVDAGLGLGEAWTGAVTAAEQAAKDTADLVPRVGRARPLAARSVGNPDAGATSLAIVLRAVDPVINKTCAGNRERSSP